MNRNIQSSSNNSSNSIENENYFFKHEKEKDSYEDEIVKNCEEDSFRKLYYSYLVDNNNEKQNDTCYN